MALFRAVQPTGIEQEKDPRVPKLQDTVNLGLTAIFTRSSSMDHFWCALQMCAALPRMGALYIPSSAPSCYSCHCFFFFFTFFFLFMFSLRKKLCLDFND